MRCFCLKFVVFFVVVSFWMDHFRDGAKRIPRYVYGSFCESIGSCWFCN